MSERFFANIKWFNKFFDDLKVLLDKITSQIEGYDHKLYYHRKSNDKPRIPRLYHVLLGSDNQLNLNLSIVLGDDRVKNQMISVDEPLIIIALHDYKKWGTTWVIENIIDEVNIKDDLKKDDSGVLSGSLDWGNEYPEIHFYAFKVPLDAFTEYSDQIVKEMIVNRVRKIQEMYDDEYGNTIEG